MTRKSLVVLILLFAINLFGNPGYSEDNTPKDCVLLPKVINANDMMDQGNIPPVDTDFNWRLLGSCNSNPYLISSRIPLKIKLDNAFLKFYNSGPPYATYGKFEFDISASGWENLFSKTSQVTIIIFIPKKRPPDPDIILLKRVINFELFCGTVGDPTEDYRKKENIGLTYPNLISIFNNRREQILIKLEPNFSDVNRCPPL